MFLSLNTRWTLKYDTGHYAMRVTICIMSTTNLWEQQLGDLFPLPLSYGYNVRGCPVSTYRQTSRRHTSPWRWRGLPPSAPAHPRSAARTCTMPGNCRQDGAGKGGVSDKTWNNSFVTWRSVFYIRDREKQNGRRVVQDNNVPLHVPSGLSLSDVVCCNTTTESCVTAPNFPENDKINCIIMHSSSKILQNCLKNFA